MKGSAFRAAGAVLLLICLVSGCGPSGGDADETTPKALHPADRRAEVTLYYRGANGYIVPAARRIRSMGNIVSEVLYAQLANAENCCVVDPLGLTPVLPRKFTFSAEVQNNVAKVDIVSGTLKPKNAREESEMVNCIVNSLCSVEGVNGVSLSVDGRPVTTLAKGTNVAGVLLPRPVNEIYAGGKTKADVTCTLYYVSGKSGLLAPVTMHFTGLPTLKQAVNAMITPKAEYGLTSMFPAGCRLIDARVEEGVVRLDFSREFDCLAEHPGLESRVLVALSCVCHELAHTNAMLVTVEGADYRPVMNFWPDAETVAAFNTLGEDYDPY